MRKLLLVAGVFCCIGGLIWVGQGTGYFPYPARSFMISQTPWAWRGGALFCVGLLLVRIARRQ